MLWFYYKKVFSPNLALCILIILILSVVKYLVEWMEWNVVHRSTFGRMDGVECSTPVKQTGSCCSAYGCSRKWKKEDKVHFHSYPLKDKHRLAKWLAAIKRDNFKPTTTSRICGDHFITSDYHPGSRELKKSAVPSVFQFPEHLQKPELAPRRPPLKRNMTTPSSSVDLSVAKKSKVSPSKDELKKIIEKQV